MGYIGLANVLLRQGYWNEAVIMARAALDISEKSVSTKGGRLKYIRGVRVQILSTKYIRGVRVQIKTEYTGGRLKYVRWRDQGSNGGGVTVQVDEE